MDGPQDHGQGLCDHRGPVAHAVRHFEEDVLVHIQLLAHPAVHINADQAQGVAHMGAAGAAGAAVSAGEERIGHDPVALLELLPVLGHHAQKLVAKYQRSLGAGMGPQIDPDVRAAHAAVLDVHLHRALPGRGRGHIL